MAESNKWSPPATVEELYQATAGNNFGAINRPTAGPRTEAPLEAGSEALQLHSLATPNGWKVGILLEELGVPYDAHVVSIGKGDQFSSGFVGANPNSKIPALVDKEGPGGEPMAVMESGAIMLYLCEKFPEKGFMPCDPRLRMECLQWLFWQVSGLSDQAEARDYGVARYGMDVQKLCDVLERHLSGLGDFRGNAGPRKEGPRTFLVGESYTVADMACFPWFETLRREGYDRPGQPRAKDFLGADKYKNLNAWADRIASRIEVKHGMQVCKGGSPKPWLQPGESQEGEGK